MSIKAISVFLFSEGICGFAQHFGKYMLLIEGVPVLEWTHHQVVHINEVSSFIETPNTLIQKHWIALRGRQKWFNRCSCNFKVKNAQREK